MQGEKKKNNAIKLHDKKGRKDKQTSVPFS